jgi:alpha,alpha-trehalase
MQLTASDNGPLDAQSDLFGHSADPLWEFSPYPPIADYGFLSDCEVTALVAPGGSVEWMCLPRLDCPSVFGALVDRDAGWFRLGPEDMTIPAERRYRPGTMVIETSWDCGEGWIVVTDCLVMGPWRHSHPDRTSHVRPPTDYDAEHTLLRLVRCVDGAVQLSMDCEPAFDYGRRRSRWRHTEKGYHQAVIRPEGDIPAVGLTHDSLTLTLTSDIRIGL